MMNPKIKIQSFDFSQIEKYSNNCQAALKKYEACNENIFLVENSFFIKKEINAIEILWCLICDEFEPEQRQGDYYLNKEKLIVLCDFQGLKNKNEIPQEILNNIWICPLCLRSVAKLSPQFDVKNW